MSPILGLLLVGAVISTAIKVSVLVVGAKAYRARQQRNSAQTTGAPSPESTPPTAAEQAL